MLYWLYWPYRLTVRTDPSQGLNRGPIPRRVTKKIKKRASVACPLNAFRQILLCAFLDRDHFVIGIKIPLVYFLSDTLWRPVSKQVVPGTMETYWKINFISVFLSSSDRARFSMVLTWVLCFFWL